MKDFDSICGEIRAERERQITKWSGDIRTPGTMVAILGEEYGEVCKALNDDDAPNFREELVQLAACCVKAIQSFDRLKAGELPHDRELDV